MTFCVTVTKMTTSRQRLFVSWALTEPAQRAAKFSDDDKRHIESILRELAHSMRGGIFGVLSQGTREELRDRYSGLSENPPERRQISNARD